MKKLRKTRDYWEIWLTGLFAVVAFAVFAFVIVRHRQISQDALEPQSIPASAASNSYDVGEFKVVRVYDGDSLTLVGTDELEFSVRLRGIDAPELGQPYGYEAKQALQALVDSGAVGLSEPKKGKYGRYVADMYCGDVWVNEAMVAEGHAWCDEVNSFNKTLYSAQQHAKSQRRSLWASPSPDPPWIWRAEHK